MKKYNQPETMILQVVNNSIICASAAPAPGRTGQLGTMGQDNGAW